MYTIRYRPHNSHPQLVELKTNHNRYHVIELANLIAKHFNVVVTVYRDSELEPFYTIA